MNECDSDPPLLTAVHSLAEILDSDLEMLAIDTRSRRLLAKWWLTGRPL